jgi:hypothetical protein
VSSQEEEGHDDEEEHPDEIGPLASDLEEIIAFVEDDVLPPLKDENLLLLEEDIDDFEDMDDEDEDDEDGEEGSDRKKRER